jgi:hypothetical protein
MPELPNSTGRQQLFCLPTGDAIPVAMPLNIETFSNARGGNAFFKAITHPVAADLAQLLLRKLQQGGDLAILDPLNLALPFNEVHSLRSLPIVDYFVQDVEALGTVLAGQAAKPLSQVSSSGARQLLIAAFDAADFVKQIRHLLPGDIDIVSFDDICLPRRMLSDHERYLSVLNFATNFAFFRDRCGQHTRLTTTNYWASYGARNAALWLRLYDESGKVLAEWVEELGSAQQAIVIDSGDVRRRFNLPAFTGQLFVHAVGIAGHDVIKYALDTYGDDVNVLSCTHDSNSWPADFYAGLPAPADEEDVVLWIQNSHPAPIPPNEIGLRVMGEPATAWLPYAIAPFATYALNTKQLLSEVRWPRQIEVVAGRYFGRPRYEVFATGGRQRLAHVNVERTDLAPDPKLPALGNILGKGYILPAPILPLDRFTSLMLPTPMATTQKQLPLAALVYDSTGSLVCEHRFGNLARDHAAVLNVGERLQQAKKGLAGGYGHVELTYDFTAGQEADGWLHALFRYLDHNSSHVAESSFGAHIFNTALTYKNEPQNYSGRAPGLSTRLFLRIGQDPYETFCQLIYPASTPWHAHSDTALILYDCDGMEMTRAVVRIPCNGSYFWTITDVFGEAARTKDGNYVIVCDKTCRLFGYQGLRYADHSFSFDHMFGF